MNDPEPHPDVRGGAPAAAIPASSSGEATVAPIARTPIARAPIARVAVAAAWGACLISSASSAAAQISPTGLEAAELTGATPEQSRVDALMLRYEAAEAFRTRARSSIVSVSAIMPALDARVELSTQPIIHGSAVAVRLDSRALLLTSRALVGDRPERLRVRLPSGRGVAARPIVRRAGSRAGAGPAGSRSAPGGADSGADPAVEPESPPIELLAAFSLDPWPAELKPLPLAQATVPREVRGMGYPGLTLTGQPLAWTGTTLDEATMGENTSVVAVAHLLGPVRTDSGEAVEGTAGLWVSSVVEPFGVALLTPELEVLGIAVALAPGTSGRTIAVDAQAIASWWAGAAGAATLPAELHRRTLVPARMSPLGRSR